MKKLQYFSGGMQLINYVSGGVQGSEWSFDMNFIGMSGQEYGIYFFSHYHWCYQSYARTVGIAVWIENSSFNMGNASVDNVQAGAVFGAENAVNYPNRIIMGNSTQETLLSEFKNPIMFSGTLTIGVTFLPNFNFTTNHDYYSFATLGIGTIE